MLALVVKSNGLTKKKKKKGKNEKAKACSRKRSWEFFGCGSLDSLVGSLGLYGWMDNSSISNPIQVSCIEPTMNCVSFPPLSLFLDFFFVLCIWSTPAIHDHQLPNLARLNINRIVSESNGKSIALKCRLPLGLPSCFIEEWRADRWHWYGKSADKLYVNIWFMASTLCFMISRNRTFLTIGPSSLHFDWMIDLALMTSSKLHCIGRVYSAWIVVTFFFFFVSWNDAKWQLRSPTGTPRT